VKKHSNKSFNMQRHAHDYYRKLKLLTFELVIIASSLLL